MPLKKLNIEDVNSLINNVFFFSLNQSIKFYLDFSVAFFLEVFFILYFFSIFFQFNFLISFFISNQLQTLFSFHLIFVQTAEYL